MRNFINLSNKSGNKQAKWIDQQENILNSFELKKKKRKTEKNG